MKSTSPTPTTTTTLLAAILLLISTTTAQYFAAIAIRSASPLHLQTIEARNERLWIGGTSTHYCPQQVQALHDCPNTHETNFGGGTGVLYMGAIVPGGQQVYIDPTCGAVMYTQAHSAFMPQGAIIDGWTLSQGENFGVLGWQGGLVGCNETADGSWEIYAQLPGIQLSRECLGFVAITVNETKADAWQYT